MKATNRPKQYALWLMCGSAPPVQIPGKLVMRRVRNIVERFAAGGLSTEIRDGRRVVKRTKAVVL